MKTIVLTSGVLVTLFALTMAAASRAAPKMPDAISPEQAASHIGKSVTVEGIAHVHEAAKATFLDFGGTYPNQQFQAVIFSDRGQLGNLKIYDGKTVDVTGVIRDYHGLPEIVVEGKGQITVR